MSSKNADRELSLISSQMMAAQQRPSSRRGASGAWSRLKPPTVDSLDIYGLPSKGETRLHDFKAQENYYNKIVERYMKFCAEAGNSDELDAQFASLSISPSSSSPASSSSIPTVKSAPASGLAASKYAPSNATNNAASNTAAGKQRRPSPQTIQSCSSIFSAASSASQKSPSAELSILLSAMRKLREAIVASNRTDTFSQRCYIFIVQAGILASHVETYHPALLHLVRDIHLRTPLSPPELHDHIGFYILDLACRQSDMRAAYEVKTAYGYKDRRVDAVLKALVHDDWVAFWRLRRAVDGYQKRLMGCAEEAVRLHALKCLGMSYFTAEKAFVERSGGAKWEELVKGGVGWKLEDGGKVVIRIPKVKPK